MSTCPEKSIHSVYADGELPKQYLFDYRNHAASCPPCNKEMRKMERIHSLLQSDSESLSLDDRIIDESFERLQIRMRYHSVVNKTGVRFAFPVKWTIPAAAALFFALFMPFRTEQGRGADAVPAGYASSVSFSSVSNASAAPVSYLGTSSTMRSGVYHADAGDNAGGALPVFYVPLYGRDRASFSALDVFRPDLTAVQQGRAKGTASFYFSPYLPVLSCSLPVPLLLTEMIELPDNAWEAAGTIVPSQP